MEPIQYAVRMKYGARVFSRFFHACAEAGRKGDLEFRPGGALYRRWRGFQDGP